VVARQVQEPAYGRRQKLWSRALPISTIRGGGYNTVKHSSSQISAGSGFILSGRGHHLFTNNIVHDCNWLPTYNAGIRQNKRDASITEDCGGNLIEYNTVFNCGRANIELNYGYGSGDPPKEEIPGSCTTILEDVPGLHPNA
jgi:hypothetical protein